MTGRCMPGTDPGAQRLRLRASADGGGTRLDSERQHDEGLLQPGTSRFGHPGAAQIRRPPHLRHPVPDGRNEPVFIANLLDTVYKCCSRPMPSGSTSPRTGASCRSWKTRKLVRNWYRKNSDTPLGRVPRCPCWQHATFPYEPDLAGSSIAIDRPCVHWRTDQLC